MVIVNVPNEVLGGVTLGLASFYYRFFHGRVLGISGFLNSPLPTVKNHDSTFKWMFLLGVAIAGALAPTELRVAEPLGHWALLPLSGLLVGFGTKLANGCTSGHGLCGLARFAQRSLAAVVTFMATGMMTRALLHPDSHESPIDISASYTLDPVASTLPLVAISVCIASYFFAQWQDFISAAWKKKREEHSSHSADSATVRSHFYHFNNLFLNGVSLLWGAIFGAGLMLTEMTSQSRVMEFLSLPTLLFSKNPVFDPSLALVMGAGMIPSLFGHFLIGDRERPFLSDRTHLGHPGSKITLKLMIGSALFGVGWAIGGICPGPGIVLLANDVASARFSAPILQWTLFSIVGAKMASLV